MGLQTLIEQTNKRLVILLTGIALLHGCADSGTSSPSQSNNDQRPNIIIILTDDQGYADLGAQSVVEDIHTPNIDQLAMNGARMTAGYASAPQCTPSRAAILAGRYQQKFGLDDNTKAPFPLTQPTLAEKLADSGYRTGMVGKWHLNINRLSETWYRETYAPGSTQPFDFDSIPSSEKSKYYPDNRGFQDIFSGTLNHFRANFDLSGEPIQTRTITDRRFRIDVTSDAAVSFIQRHARTTPPFFLYVPYYAPHVPLEATEAYLSQFSEPMAERRRYALAMLAAVDKGVGRIIDQLRQQRIDNNTLIFFLSDNGAPLALDKEDKLPVSLFGPYWDGSLNEPWLGEKGMLSEGAIRVPFIAHWPGKIPAGQYPHPVLSIDASTTAAALAGIDTTDMDGINLLPYLQDTNKIPERALYWRFWNQAAIREGKWKYLIAGNENKYLFDLDSAQHEQINLIDQHPDIATGLHQKLAIWAADLKYPGLPDTPLRSDEKMQYEYHLPQNSLRDPHAHH